MSVKSYSLSELATHLQQVIKVNFDTPLWIRAEISEYRENSNGHCYLELIEKNSDTDHIVAKLKATIWNNTFRMLKPYFEKGTGQSLRAGLNVLVAVTVDFHGLYGLSLNIKDIDPSFTLGALAARRQEIIRQLETDGVMEMNKMLELPALTRRLAVISSATAAGYDDFCNQLQNNSEGFIFYHKLFPAIMQGDAAEDSIITALESIFEHALHFDAVVIIRGGGATTDLACFDSYHLALNCAQFPLPIISGIGHQRDLTILDLVAHSSVKTPTAAAEFLIDRMMEARTMMTDAMTGIYQALKQKTNAEQQWIADTNWKIKQALHRKTADRNMLLERQKSRLTAAVHMLMQHHQNKLMLIEKSIERHSPAFLLQYGYTITTVNGKRITSAAIVEKGDLLRTYLSDGSIESTVI